MLPGLKDQNRSILGAIVPHGREAGVCQAWAYKEIGESAMPDVFVLLSDRGDEGKTCFSNLDWTTPFGTVKCELDLAKTLQEAGFLLDNDAHRQYPAALAQLPFIQFASKAFLKDISILSILVGSDIENASEAIRTIQKFKRPMIITVSDFTKYGMAYGFVPPWDDVDASIESLDAGAVDRIKVLDSPGFFQYTAKHGTNYSGRNSISVLLDILKEKSPKANVLSHHLSSEGDGMNRDVVSTATVLFE